MADFSFDERRRGEAAELALAGDLDMGATFRLEPALDRLIEDESVSEVVLDLGGIEFVDSSGLGLLLNAYDRTRDADVALRIRPGSEATQRVFLLAGVEDALPSTAGE